MKLRFIALVAVLAIPIVILIVRRPAPPDAGRAARGTEWQPTPGSEPVVDPATGVLHLPVDRRFVAAVGAIHAILTGRPARSARTAFEDGRWRVTHGGKDVGSVPAAPSFDELEGLLAAWARTLAREETRDPVAALRADRADPQAASRRERALRALDRLDPEAALRDVDRAWSLGKRSADDAAIAAAALALMAAVAVDRMGATDELAARALAALAIAEVSGPPQRRQRALIARVLGYDADARREAMALPEDDPVRAFVLGEAARLDAAARAPGVSGLTRVLGLLRLAGAGDRASWAALVEPWIEQDREPELFLLATGLAVDPAREDASIAARAPWDLRVVKAAFARLTREGTGPGGLAAIAHSDLVSLAARFEQSLAGLPASVDGAYLDRAVLRSFYRATFYSALARLAEPSFTAVAAGPALTSVTVAVDPGDTPSRAADFGAWCAAMAEASGESGNPHRALLRLRLLRWFGAPAMMAVYDSLERHLPDDDPALEQARRTILERIDGRPNNLRLLSRRPG